MAADVSDWPDFDEVSAADHVRSAMKLSGEDKIHRIQAYRLARKPDNPGDMSIERSRIGGLKWKSIGMHIR